MNQKEFNNVIASQIERCKSMLAAKGGEYAPKAGKNTNADRLEQFKKAAVMVNLTPKAALMGMLSKHLISISDMCICDEKYPKEQWDEKITDSINYLLLLRALVEEEQNEEDRSENTESGKHRPGRKTDGLCSKTDTERPSDIQSE